MLRVREIQVQPLLKDGAPVPTPDGRPATTPVLDEHGQEIERYSIEIPATVEAEGPAAIDAYVAAQVAALASTIQSAPLPAPTDPEE